MSPVRKRSSVTAAHTTVCPRMVCVSFRFVTLNKIRITRATKRARSRGAGVRASVMHRRDRAMRGQLPCMKGLRRMRPAVSTGNQTAGRAVRVASSRGTHPDADV